MEVMCEKKTNWINIAMIVIGMYGFLYFMGVLLSWREILMFDSYVVLILAGFGGLVKERQNRKQIWIALRLFIATSLFYICFIGLVSAEIGARDRFLLLLHSLLLSCQLWAIADGLYGAVMLRQRFKSYWSWLLLLLPVIGPIYYFRKKNQLVL